MTVQPMPDSGPHGHPFGTTDAAGVVELATDAEVVSNPTVQEALAVTPYTLGRYTGLVGGATTVESDDLFLMRDTSVDQDVSVSLSDLKGAVTPPQATIEVQGIVELATNTEAADGLDTERAVTPAGLGAWAEAHPSTETERGLIERATDAEVIAGTDTERAVTPAGLEAWAGAIASKTYGLHRARVSSPVIVGEEYEFVMPFDALSTEVGDPLDASLSGNKLVLIRSGLYQVRAAGALNNIRGNVAIVVKYWDAQGTLLRSVTDGEGGEVDTTFICASYSDFMWMPAGGMIGISLFTRGGGNRDLLLDLTELAVLRIAD